MTARATPTASVLNDSANRLLCSSIRNQLMACLSSHVINKDERKRGVANAKACDDPEQLFKWLKNTRLRVRQREEEDIDASDDDDVKYGTLDTDE